MTEAAGLVIGVVALWKTCVTVFDTVDSSQRYGMDYELLRVKLEVERIRLLNWGDAVGIADAGAEKIDPRLKREDVRNTVTRVLGCIQHIFSASVELQSKYGLRPLGPQTASNAETEGEGQLILGHIFKRSYECLKKNAKERQRGTSIARIAAWVIHDKRQFNAMVLEIKGFNDNLESLFPGIGARTAEAMLVDINSSDNVQELQLLQDATIDEHEELSESASARLDILGAASTARSELLTISENDYATGNEAAMVKKVEVETDAGTEADDSATVVNSTMSEYEKRMNVIEDYFAKKRTGSLSVSVMGPYDYSTRVSTYCYWDGENRDDDHPFNDRQKGYTKSGHAAFDLYWKKRFTKRRRNRYDGSEENAVLFDVESYPTYEHNHPGTLTVDGFGLEAWDYEISHHPETQTILVSYEDPGPIEAKQLLRRIDELQKDATQLGWTPPEVEEDDLKEFMGKSLQLWRTKEYGDYSAYFSSFFSMLNRRDIFVDLLSTSSIGAGWNNPKEPSKFWNFLWQIILGKELGRRLESHTGDSYTTGFTPRVLSTVIVADLWMRHVELVLVDQKVDLTDFKEAANAEEKQKAEEFKIKGNEALKKEKYEEAIDLYTEAIRMDMRNPIYRANRSAPTFALGRYEDSLEDAYISIKLDPKYSKAWSRYGMAAMKLGFSKRAKNAYETAVSLAGKDATAVMRTGLKNAEAQVQAEMKAIDDERDKRKRHALVKSFLNQDWDILFKTVEVHSRVHEQQVEGLLLFAEKIKWSYINEVRDYAEEAYSNLRGGETIPIDLHDWLFGMTLPGKWFSFKIMSALILCTSSLKETLDIAPFFDCGLSLPKKSYWRVRTVLGRVLGCLPGVQSNCGWLGPCPPVEFIPSTESKPRHIRLKARQLTPIEHRGRRKHDGVIDVSGSSVCRYQDTRPKEDEELEPWISEIMDASNWIIPEPPVQQVSTCELKSIQLKRDLSVREQEEESKAMYRAQIVFKMDDRDDLITYRLFTNPTFVSLPPCHPGPKGNHEIHMRELHRYETVWTIEMLKDHTAEDTDGKGVMVINATGKGAELLARAWCSERGRNAIIRKPGGPCFVCAERAASSAGLGTGVLIWVG